jgi:hypothetical protein
MGVPEIPSQSTLSPYVTKVTRNEKNRQVSKAVGDAGMGHTAS